MMKSMLMLLAAPFMASAFAPSTFSSRAPTKINQLYDPNTMYDKADEADASRIVFEECSIEDCVTAEASRDPNGQWHQNNASSGEPVSRRVLMMEVDSTE